MSTIFCAVPAFIRDEPAITSGPANLNEPVGIAIGPDGNLYVTDYSLGRIEVFTPDGESLGLLGERGAGQGTFSAPVGIDFDAAGAVYVTDQRLGTLQKLTVAG